jgi:hypothetical protein
MPKLYELVGRDAVSAYVVVQRSRIGGEDGVSCFHSLQRYLIIARIVTTYKIR